MRNKQILILFVFVLVIIPIIYIAYISLMAKYFYPKCLMVLYQVQQPTFKEYVNNDLGIRFVYPSYTIVEEYKEKPRPNISLLVERDYFNCHYYFGELLTFDIRVNNLNDLNTSNNLNENIEYYLNRFLEESRQRGGYKETTVSGIKTYLLDMGLRTNEYNPDQMNDYLLTEKDRLIHLRFSQNIPLLKHCGIICNLYNKLIRKHFDNANEKIKQTILNSIHIEP